jgi:hypothetical protein
MRLLLIVVYLSAQTLERVSGRPNFLKYAISFLAPAPSAVAGSASFRHLVRFLILYLMFDLDENVKSKCLS